MLVCQEIELKSRARLNALTKLIKLSLGLFYFMRLTKSVLECASLNCGRCHFSGMATACLDIFVVVASNGDIRNAKRITM